ncbi:hypothetical protein [Bauldia sp.]|uniref:hypothetical protein n=1 Tax=Bauldia sp. TaxID=2575872 RepID=UPI003BAC1F8E
MSDYLEAVGTFLTNDMGKAEGQDVTSRSLLTFSEGALAVLIDANQAGVTGFGPYSAATGSWRGVSNSDGIIRVSAVVLHFTFATSQFPEKKIGRVDIDATIDTNQDTLSGTFRLFLFPIDGDPLGPIPEEPALSGPITGQKVVAAPSG